ncbi:MAG: PEP-CTERM sorting domain-containing protein, partial [Opitutales bacterium]
ADPTNQTVELFGTANTSFTDWWLVSIESDAGSSEGVVDRAFSFSGSFDANGIFTVTVPDLENPSFTYILTDDFTGAEGNDLDAGDTGTLDTAPFGTIFDAVGVIEDSGDPDYATALGGTYLAPFASTDPDLVFRSDSTGDWYYTNIAGDDLYDTAGNLVGVTSALLGSADPTSFGSVNPVVPEPGSFALLAGIFGMTFVMLKRRQA